MSTKRRRDFSRQEIYDFVKDYCFSPLFNNLGECATAHDISKQTAKALIYKAIEECIVEDDVVDILCFKAYQSAFWHACEDEIYKAPYVTYKKYEELKERRKHFCLPDEHCIAIVMLYLSSPSNKKLFCEQNTMTRSLFDRTLVTAITHNLVTDNFVADLKYKALATNSTSTDSVEKLFDELKTARKKYKQQHI